MKMKKQILILSVFFSAFSVFTLPAGFKNVTLGMSVDEVKANLSHDYEFGYRGDRDVSLSPSDNQVIIETDAAFASYSYLDHCWFQFSDGKLCVITINLNQEKMDHYSVFKRLCEKYGDPGEISPEKAVWKDTVVIMSLEKPLTLKYIDATVFAAKQKASTVQKSVEEQSRDDFLMGL